MMLQNRKIVRKALRMRKLIVRCRDHKICMLRKKGWSQEKIGFEVDLCTQRIHQILRKNRIAPLPKSKRTAFLGITITPTALRSLKVKAKRKDTSVSILAARYIDQGLRK